MVGQLRFIGRKYRSKLRLPIHYGGRGGAQNTQKHALAPKYTRVPYAHTPQFSRHPDGDVRSKACVRQAEYGKAIAWVSVLVRIPWKAVVEGWVPGYASFCLVLFDPHGPCVTGPNQRVAPVGTNLPECTLHAPAMHAHSRLPLVIAIPQRLGVSGACANLERKAHPVLAQPRRHIFVIRRRGWVACADQRVGSVVVGDLASARHCLAVTSRL